MKIYLAGPITGKSYDEVVSMYREKTKVLSGLGYDVLCPMTGKEYLRNEVEFKAHGFDQSPISTNHAIFERDKWMVERADIILADLSNSGNRVSIGAVMELAWASITGTHSIVILPEDNIHQHAFVLEAGDIIFETLEDAMKYLKILVSGK